jgi:hypothetical protein
MSRLVAALLGGAAQAGFMQHRKKKEVSAVDTAVFSAIYRYALSLLAVIGDTVYDASPHDLGKFLSTIRQLSCQLAPLLLQYPTPEQTIAYCEKLYEHVQSQCPTIDISSTQLVGLAAMLSKGMMYRRASSPQRMSIESDLLPLNSDEARFRAAMYNSSLTCQFIHGLMAGLRPVLRHRFNYFQFALVARGFGVEEWRRLDLPDPENLGIQNVDFEDYVEVEYRPTGARVPLALFCKPLKTVEDGSTCSICDNDVEMKGEGDEAPVITACGYHFHQTCIDSWINESGRRTANLCPTCRMEMCQGRPRVPASMLDQLEGPLLWSEFAKDEDYDKYDEYEDDTENNFAGLPNYTGPTVYSTTISPRVTSSITPTFSGSRQRKNTRSGLRQQLETVRRRGWIGLE